MEEFYFKSSQLNQTISVIEKVSRYNFQKQFEIDTEKYLEKQKTKSCIIDPSGFFTSDFEVKFLSPLQIEWEPFVHQFKWKQPKKKGVKVFVNYVIQFPDDSLQYHVEIKMGNACIPLKISELSELTPKVFSFWNKEQQLLYLSVDQKTLTKTWFQQWMKENNKNVDGMKQTISTKSLLQSSDIKQANANSWISFFENSWEPFQKTSQYYTIFNESKQIKHSTKRRIEYLESLETDKSLVDIKPKIPKQEIPISTRKQKKLFTFTKKSASVQEFEKKKGKKK